MARWGVKDVEAYNARRRAGAAKGAPSQAVQPVKTSAASAARVKEPKQPNGTEREYEQLYLIPEKAARAIVDYKFHSVALVLGVDWRYYPDWFVLPANGRPQVREVKGGYRKDEKRYRHAIKSFKAAVDQFGDYFDFFLCEKSNTGEWKITEYRKGARR